MTSSSTRSWSARSSGPASGSPRSRSRPATSPRPARSTSAARSSTASRPCAPWEDTGGRSAGSCRHHALRNGGGRSDGPRVVLGAGAGVLLLVLLVVTVVVAAMAGCRGGNRLGAEAVGGVGPADVVHPGVGGAGRAAALRARLVLAVEQLVVEGGVAGDGDVLGPGGHVEAGQLHVVDLVPGDADVHRQGRAVVTLTGGGHVDAVAAGRADPVAMHVDALVAGADVDRRGPVGRADQAVPGVVVAQAQPGAAEDGREGQAADALVVVDEHVGVGAGTGVGEQDGAAVVVLEAVVGDLALPGGLVGDDPVAAGGVELVVGHEQVPTDEAGPVPLGGQAQADAVVLEDGVADQVPGGVRAGVHAGAVLLGAVLLVAGDPEDGEAVPGDVVGQQPHRAIQVEVLHDRLGVATGAGGVAVGVGAREGEAVLAGADRDRLGVQTGADPDGAAGVGDVDRTLDGVEGIAGAEAGPVVAR